MSGLLLHKQLFAQYVFRGPGAVRGRVALADTLTLTLTPMRTRAEPDPEPYPDPES